MWAFFVGFVFLNGAAFGADQNGPRELVLVHAIWRHGDRTPTLTWPTNAEIKWPAESGQLSAVGMAQQFILGRMLGERYMDFIGEEYKPKHVYVRTTDYDRTVMSALSNMAGMFEGRPGYTIPQMDAWPASWRPIALYNFPRRIDNILQISASCPLLDTLRTELLELPEFERFWVENEELFQLIVNETGLPVFSGSLQRDYLTGFYHGVTDAILIYKEHGRPVPEWVTDEVFHHMENMSLHWFYHNFAGEQISKYVGGGGSLVKDIVERMQLKAACITDPTGANCRAVNDLKYYAYSAHDTTVTAFTSAVRAFDVRQRGLPGYAGCIVVELYKEPDGTFSVQAFYRQEPAGERSQFEPIALFGRQRCSLSSLAAAAQSVMPKDWHAECNAARTKRAARRAFDYSVALD